MTKASMQTNIRIIRKQFETYVNNISKAQVPGTKEAQFHPMLNTNTAGSCSLSHCTTANHENGPITHTGNNGDITLNGGYMAFKSKNGEVVYKTTASMRMNKAGNIEDMEGNILLAMPQDRVNGTTTAANLIPVKIESKFSSSPTENISVAPNLPPNDANGVNRDIEVQYVGANGNSEIMTIRFMKTGVNTWTMSARDSQAAAITFGGQNTLALTFDASGNLESMAGQRHVVNIAAQLQNQAINIDIKNLTQKGGVFDIGTGSLKSDGSAASRTGSEFEIDEDGNIITKNSSGIMQKQAVLATATFANRSGLKEKDAGFIATNHSGNPTIGNPKSLNVEVMDGSVEESNINHEEQVMSISEVKQLNEISSLVMNVSHKLIEEIIQSIKQQ